MRRRFVKRNWNGGRRAAPSREWVSLATGWSLSAVTATTAVSLISLQAPTSLALTSDPPEDLTVLRIIGDYQTLLLSDAAATWTLALLVQDTTWTPSALFGDDADKRILWSQTFVAANATSDGWNAPGYMESPAGTVVASAPREATHLDISPRVRLEAGKALYLVAYEAAGTGSLTSGSANMRMLFQRSGRR